jgi:hypothetical protein
VSRRWTASADLRDAPPRYRVTWCAFPDFQAARRFGTVHVYAQKYDNATSGNSDRLRFERAYQVVPNGERWRAAREGRVPKEIRGEPK